MPIQRTHELQQNPVGELWVEAEIVDLIVTVDAVFEHLYGTDLLGREGYVAPRTPALCRCRARGTDHSGGS
jgi:hypothetical protein